MCICDLLVHLTGASAFAPAVPTVLQLSLDFGKLQLQLVQHLIDFLLTYL